MITSNDDDVQRGILDEIQLKFGGEKVKNTYKEDELTLSYIKGNQDSKDGEDSKHSTDSKHPPLYIITTPSNKYFSRLKCRSIFMCNIFVLVLDIRNNNNVDMDGEILSLIECAQKNGKTLIICLHNLDKNSKEFNISDNQFQTLKHKIERVGYQVRLYNKYNDECEKKADCLLLDRNDLVEGLSLILSVNDSLENSSQNTNFECYALGGRNSQGRGGTLDIILTKGVLTTGDTIISGDEDAFQIVETKVKAILDIENRDTRDRISGMQVARIVGAPGKDLKVVLPGSNIRKTKLKMSSKSDCNNKHVNSGGSGDADVMIIASKASVLEAISGYLHSKQLKCSGTIGKVSNRAIILAGQNKYKLLVVIGSEVDGTLEHMIQQNKVQIIQDIDMDGMILKINTYFSK